MSALDLLSEPVWKLGLYLILIDSSYPASITSSGFSRSPTMEKPTEVYKW